MRSAYQGFVGLLEEQCRVLVRHHLEAATSEFAMSLFGEDDLSLGQLTLQDEELENAAPPRPATDGARRRVPREQPAPLAPSRVLSSAQGRVSR